MSEVSPPVQLTPAPRPTMQLPTTTTPFPNLFSNIRRVRRRSRIRLVSAPDMFGDFLSVGSFSADTGLLFVFLDSPTRGHVKIAENNKAVPVDRVYFTYNHFRNAIDVRRVPLVGAGTASASSVDRYTFGIEKTFYEEMWSVELRMPFMNEFDFGSPDAVFDGGLVGNLAVLLKRLLYESDQIAVAAGLGIGTPTGSDTHGRLPLIPLTFSVENEAVHLLPYLAVSGTPSDRFFYHLFAQLDIDTNGNEVNWEDAGLGITGSGRLNGPNLLYLDSTIGYWLMRNPSAEFVNGIASVVELHYTTTLQDVDAVPISLGVGTLESATSRFDILNLTVGLHIEFGGLTSVRIGGVFPLRTGENRMFDSEVMATVIRRF